MSILYHVIVRLVRVVDRNFLFGRIFENVLAQSGSLMMLRLLTHASCWSASSGSRMDARELEGSRCHCGLTACSIYSAFHPYCRPSSNTSDHHPKLLNHLLQLPLIKHYQRFHSGTPDSQYIICSQHESSSALPKSAALQRLQQRHAPCLSSRLHHSSLASPLPACPSLATSSHHCSG